MKRFLENAFWAVWVFVAVAWIVTPVRAMVNPDDAGETRPRLAFVIGNSTYVSNRYPVLPNAANDAEKLSESLERLKFQVVKGVNLTAAQFEDMLKQYEPKLSSYSAVLIFYSGHAIQYKGENYLLPVDSLDPESMKKLTQKAIRLNDVIARLSNSDRPTLIFLDACRNNPVGNAKADGLAKVEAGENNYVAFATTPGKAALDGVGENSPFTSALLQTIEVPGLDVSNMMIKVRTETERLTLRKQSPWEQSNLRAQFYFTEEQTLDPQELNSLLNQILRDPKLTAQLKVQLASAGDSADLQTAVLNIGKQMPPTVRAVPTPAQAAVRPLAAETKASGAPSVTGTQSTSRVTQGVVLPTKPDGTASLELGASSVQPGADSDKPAAAAATTGRDIAAAEHPQSLQPSGLSTGSLSSSTFRSTETLGAPSLGVIKPAAPQGVQVASADPQVAMTPLSQLILGIVRDDGESDAVAETDSQQVASADVSQMRTGPGSEAPRSQVVEKNVAQQIQHGLARVGCYRQNADGAWGAGSRKALDEYFRRTGQGGRSLDPSPEVMSDLFFRSGRICRQPVPVKPAAKVATIEKRPVKQAKGAGGKAREYTGRLKSNQRDPGTISVAVGL